MRHYIDALYALARAGQTVPIRRTPTSTHDNPLRRLGRAMAALEARQIRGVKTPGRNPSRREKRLIRRELGLTTGRAWRRWLKAANRAETGAAFRGVAS